eukprot:TRINITY_DN2126_c0_g1_i2.p2 TRINITY_DN2126_c0_g1~~TRINITY_DN2126_c0_g1_i2.p2  ORF type:complete len:181 (+),score=38.59 TRINITY_DN2126_c0_g1_i2:94-636(+)
MPCRRATQQLCNLGGTDIAEQILNNIAGKVPFLDPELLLTSFKSAALIEKFTDKFCEDPSIIKGQKVPTQCEGPIFDLLVDGGACVLDHDSEGVTCYPPRVLLVKTPARCNLEFETATIVQGRECKVTHEFGDLKSGNFTKFTKSFQLGGGLNAKEGITVFKDFAAAISDILGLGDKLGL